MRGPEALPIRLALGLAGLAAVALALSAAPSASGQAIVQGGNLHLGIQAGGQLSVCSTAPAAAVGSTCPSPTAGTPGLSSSNCGGYFVSLHYDPGGNEAMDCDFEGEGWGVAYATGPSAMAYKQSTALWPVGTPPTAICPTATAWATPPAPPLAPVFSASPSSASSLVAVGDLLVAQVYRPHVGVPDVYDDRITLTNNNLTSALPGVQYRRVMSWGSSDSGNDLTTQSVNTLPNPPGYPSSPVPPQLVKAGAVGSSTCPDPVTPWNGCMGPPSTAAPLHHACYNDVAMVWDFGFGTLAPGQNVTFTLFYGGAANETAALADVAAVNAQVYDLSHSWNDPRGERVTFLMAFGGLPVPPTPPPPPAPPPVARIVSTPPTACWDNAISFDGSSSTSPRGTIVSWQWDFGDGTTASGAVPGRHAFPQRNTSYAIGLTVVDDGGHSAATSVRVFSPDNDCPPVVDPDPDRIVQPGTHLRICPVAWDPDNDPLAWTFEGLPPDAYLDGNCIVWPTTGRDAGHRAHFRVTVSDGRSWDAMSFDVQVLNPRELADCGDTDMDGVCDIADDCPNVPDQDQLDVDGDSLGDACEPSRCPGNATCGSELVSRRPLGPLPVHDIDRDGVEDMGDNCPSNPNHDQADLDGDGQGDMCDPDLDGDGVPDKMVVGVALDNCPRTPNQDQADSLGDGRGDACRPWSAPTAAPSLMPKAAAVASPSASVWGAVALLLATLLAVLWRYRGGAVVLFSRLRSSDLLGHPLRAQVLEALGAQPGLNAVELARRIGCSRRAMTYHLDVLRLAGLVRARQEGGNVAYFDARQEMPPAAWTTADRVLATLAEGPASAAEIQRRLQLSKQLVSHHLRRLAREGRVVRPALPGGPWSTEAHQRS